MTKDMEWSATIAAYLYDGGWRSSDKDEMMEYYGLDPEEADSFCEWLDRYAGLNGEGSE